MRDYRGDIVREYKDMELFGYVGTSMLARQPLDLAYIELETRSTTSSGSPRRVDAALAASQSTVETGRGQRMLIVGPAGSGKTTVMQYLAVRAARRAFPNELAAWNEYTPFVVRLRQVFVGTSPVRPTEHVLWSQVSNYRQTEVPGQWLRDNLDRAALVILDGWDSASSPAACCRILARRSDGRVPTGPLRGDVSPQRPRSPLVQR